MKKAPRLMAVSAVLFFVKKQKASCASLLPSLVAGASHQLLVFVFAHLFLSFFDYTSHGITSIFPFLI
jgi:hypothetical protein